MIAVLGQAEEVARMRFANSEKILVGAVALFAFCFGPAAADGHEVRVTASVETTSVGTPTYDRSGRLVLMETKRYDESGEYLGIAVHEYTWSSDGKLLSSHSARYDAEDLQLSRMETKWRLNVPGKVRVGRRSYHDRFDKLTRSERETWTRDGELRILTIETLVFNADGELRNTRYEVIERNAKGGIVGWDRGTYDANGVQLSRMFSKWRYEGKQLVRIERYMFDDKDELSGRETELRFYQDDSSRISRIVTTLKDGAGNTTGYRREAREYDGHKRLVQRMITHSDADDSPVRRTIESISRYGNGRLKSRRTTTETF